jgi:carbon-monoxide dehydrogenase medium subunit/2-furoyl-CoA dehydrogenase FAD binding subunit
VKPAAFEYHCPATVEEALRLFGRLGDEATPLAGGQSLVPMMNLRLAQPEALVDLNGLRELEYIARDGDWLAIGALTREKTVERSPEVAEHAAVLQLAVEQIAFPGVRTRGTVGGSISHADPAAEIFCAMLALDAKVVLRSESGARELSIEDYVLGPYMNSREPTELLTEIRIPLAGGPMRAGFAEVARKHSDFALALGACVLRLEQGVCRAVRLAVGGADTSPRRCRAAEERLVGQVLSQDLIREAGRIAAGELDAFDTPHGSRDYKKQIYSVQAARALARAAWPEVGSAA